MTTARGRYGACGHDRFARAVIRKPRCTFRGRPMSRTYVTKQGDMVDAIAFRVYGSEHRGTTEAILAANPGLCERGPVLPANVRIVLPDLPKPAPREIATVDIWS